MKRRFCVLLLIMGLLFSFLPPAQAAYQDTNRFTHGFQRLLLAPFQVPVQTLQGTMYGPLVTGTLQGVLSGTFQTVTDLVGGTFDVAASVAPYAKYAVFFV